MPKQAVRERPDTIPAPTWSQLCNLRQALKNEKHASEEEQVIMTSRRRALQQLLIQYAAQQSNAFAVELLEMWLGQDG